MPVPATSTYDIVGAPRRPSLADVGGATMLDDQTYPPDVATMPFALALNQWQIQLAGLNQTAPLLTISFRVSAGNLVLDSFGCMSTLVVGGTFTITVNGAGDTSVTWPANTFPTAIAKPEGGITGNTVGQIAVEAITNGIRIRTTNTTGTATTLACTVRVY